jgi:hypothetical protein
MEFCYTDPDCSPGYVCDTSVTGLTNPDGTGYLMCSAAVTCNPITSTGCDTGESCYVWSAETVCRPVGTLTLGAVCGGAGNCIIGLGCYRSPSATDFTCQEFCDLAGTAHPCPTGQTCGGLGHATYGVCSAG